MSAAIERRNEARASTSFVVRLGTSGKVVCQGDDAVLCPSGGLSESRKLELEQGPVVALEHHLRGYFMLHASSVSRGGHALAFMGGPGTGKSTLAAWMVQRGFELVSDGMTLVPPHSNMLWRGPVRFKLSDESIGALGLSTDGAFVNERALKRFVHVDGSSVESQAELKTVYWVVDGDSEEVTNLCPQAQLMALLANGYLGPQMPSTRRPLLLKQAAELLNRGVTVKKLVRRKCWQALPVVEKLLEKDFGR
jgi:hypothetical protein